MGRLIVFAAVVFVGATGWNVLDRLSVDALTMGVGLLFGFVAAMPALIVATSRRTAPPPLPRKHFQPPAPAQITHVHNHVHFHQAQAQHVVGATQRKIAAHG